MYAPQGGGFGFAPPPQHRSLLPQLPGSAPLPADTPGQPTQTIGQQFGALKKALGLAPPPQMPGATLPGTAPVTAAESPIAPAAEATAAPTAGDAASAGGDAAAEGGIGDFLSALFGA